MNVLIIEDENLTAKRLESLIKRYDASIQVLEQISSVSEAVQWLKTHTAPDLIFMDIHLEDDLAFRIFEQVSLTTPVIFTTAFDEYMIKAFKVNSIDYLLKPVNFDELSAAINKFKSLKSQYNQVDMDTLLTLLGKKEQEYKTRFMITVGTRIRTVDAADIAYFFSEEKITFLVTKDNQRLPIDFSLDKLTTMMNPDDFFRVNRQFLVRLPAIKNIHTYSKGKLKLDLQPVSSEEVFVSMDKVTDFKEWLGK
ncbi:LytTR family DNA-binding domain-containing protein [Nibrella viscosa]|uniref:LytTR family DNA-binding domain-containing protein n=1 Tax=Nibrella viscosa TaxID=1084524 RepID=A0ABP8KRG8_9BACT